MTIVHWSSTSEKRMDFIFDKTKNNEFLESKVIPII